MSRDGNIPKCRDMAGSKIKQEKESGLPKHPVSFYSRRQSRLLSEVSAIMDRKDTCGSVMRGWCIGCELQKVLLHHIG